MDESAEWRQRFDMEVEKSQMCIKELDQVCSVCGVFCYNVISMSSFEEHDP